MLNYLDVIKAQSGVPVKDIWAQLWGNTMSTEYVITTYEGTLPAVLTGTKAGYLHRYKIYGERTENLFDFNRQRSNTFVLDLTKYIYGARADIAKPDTQAIKEFEYNNDNFMILSTTGAGIGFLVEAKPNTTYTISYQCDATVAADRSSAAVNTIMSDGTFGACWAIYGSDRDSTFTTNANTAYVYFVLRTVGLSATYSNIMFVEGSTAPESYIPYEECGERTVNLFDKNAKNAANGYEEGKVLRPNGSSPLVSGAENYITTEYIAIPNNATNLTLVKNSPSNISGICFYDTNKDYISGASNKTGAEHAVISCPAEAVYFRTVIHKQYIDKAMVVAGSTAPTSYIPYGYKLPLTAGSTPVDIYIGDDTLSTEEYIDSGTGKIYRMVDGVLTPTDPPVSFPQIPTSANSTTISWAGSGLAPSKVELEYEKRG